MNRRTFLKLAFSSIANTILGISCTSSDSKKTERPLEQIINREDIIRLPDHGKVYIVNDFHANFSDYQTFKEQTKIFDRIRQGEDVYFVINGDIIDYKPQHSEINGDTKILNDLIKEKEELKTKEKEDRLILLRGNHEDVVLGVYPQMKQIMAQQNLTQGQVARAIYTSRNGNFYRQFNFIERMTDEHYNFMKEFDLIVKCDNGTIITHGSYPRSNSEDPIQDILWGREGDGDKFLKNYGGELIINGHSFPSTAKELGGRYDKQKKMAVIDKDRVIIAPSHNGGLGGTYLKLDLSKIYKTDADLKVGEEVIPLRAN